MTRPAFIAAIAVCLAFCLCQSGWAETGMGLTIDKNSKKIRRIDLLNDKIIHTTGEFGSQVKHARFAPDGNKIVYSDENKKVHICDLNGKVTKSFSVWTVGDVSWTSSGIWVGGQDKVVVYDPSTGAQKKEVKVSGYKIRVVSHSETLATARTSNPTEVHAVLMDQGNKVIHGGGGCSNVPNPAGTHYTHNLWEDGKQHQTMKIEHRNGSTTHYFYIFDLLPYPTTPDKNWTWNSQAWSSNSNEIILIPAGRGYPQQNQSTVPWIYNLKTKNAVCLHADYKKLNVFWYIVDYYSGKVASGCSTASQCNDGDPCTTDSCSGGKCQHAPVSGCCKSNNDCDDKNPCTTDSCDTASGNCSNKKKSGCCAVDTDCDDTDICTTDKCSSNKCQHSAVSGCCKASGDCDDSDPCTKDSCKGQSCENTSISGCCTKDSQCDDGNQCTTDACTDNKCQHTPMSGCCAADSDCADTNPCTKDSCDTTTGTCANEAVTGCCAFDTDCDDSDPCTDDSCDVATNTCDHVPGWECQGDGGASGQADGGASKLNALSERRLTGGCSTGAGGGGGALLFVLVGVLLLSGRRRFWT